MFVIWYFQRSNKYADGLRQSESFYCRETAILVEHHPNESAKKKYFDNSDYDKS